MTPSLLCRRLYITAGLLLPLVILTTLSTLSAAESEPKQPSDPPLITAPEAAANIGKECVVEFKVLSANLKNEKSNCFLNSKGNFRDKDNFQVIIFAKDLPKFKAAKIEDPALHFAGKTIRVRGKIETHKDKPEIEVRTPEQITIVETPQETKPAPKSVAAE
jgi:DNA/RNA endonuclease YhcR with UshA esterase domain